ncbi:hypothetical protein [Bartonella sp. TP]|uniref:hypothetical protein n=1 Tax=Bartonella sp. TP TaxID=3057550 RepID=UPI0025AFCDE1|nr:hypothetical protein [Bartonella sp. TP]WJW80174.1 hypothetical protein QVL57_01000 [Bartonella sp. TP]
MQKNFLPKYLHTFLIVFTSAIIAHICTVLYFQLIRLNPAYNQLIQTYPRAKFSEIAEKDLIFSNRDIFFKYYICPFNIPNKAIHILSKEAARNFWALSFYDNTGELVYSLNSELIHHKPLDIILSTPLQLSLVHKYYRDTHIYSADSTLMIARGITNGFAVLKAYAHTPDELKSVQSLISSTSCEII